MFCCMVKFGVLFMPHQTLMLHGIQGCDKVSYFNRPCVMTVLLMMEVVVPEVTLMAWACHTERANDGKRHVVKVQPRGRGRWLLWSEVKDGVMKGKEVKR